ncbi:MAG: hypothetical protein ABR570_02600 [Burkholderiales bacterium]
MGSNPAGRASLISEELAEGAERALDATLVHVEMGDEPHASRS